MLVCFVGCVVASAHVQFACDLFYRWRDKAKTDSTKIVGALYMLQCVVGCGVASAHVQVVCGLFYRWR